MLIQNIKETLIDHIRKSFMGIGFMYDCMIIDTNLTDKNIIYFGPIYNIPIDIRYKQLTSWDKPSYYRFYIK